MPFGLLDLSIVTDRLLERLNLFTAGSHLWDADPASQFTIKYTGLAPEAARADTDPKECQVSLYLFHVAADKFNRNTFPTGGSAQAIPEQPMALTLYYLLTAYASSYIKEQQAMSVALKCLHESPIVTTRDPRDRRNEEFTVTLEPQSADEIGRIWQSINAPMRLSAVYRASVVFIEAPAPVEPKPVRVIPQPKAAPLGGAPTRAGEPTFDVDTSWMADVVVPGAGFATAATTVHVRALALKELPAGPIAAEEFQVTSADSLQLRLPRLTPPGLYALHLRPKPMAPEIDAWLDVPYVAAPIFSTDANGVATVVVPNVVFGAATSALFQGRALLLVNVAPAPGQFLVTGNDTLLLRVPTTAKPGRYPLLLQASFGAASIDAWIDVR